MVGVSDRCFPCSIFYKAAGCWLYCEQDKTVVFMAGTSKSQTVMRRERDGFVFDFVIVFVFFHELLFPVKWPQTVASVGKVVVLVHLKVFWGGFCTDKEHF